MITSYQHNPDAISITPGMCLSIPKSNEVMIYWANLDELDVQFTLLAESEQLRAGQYARIRDRNRFKVRRSLLRLLLSAYLNRSARDISLRHTPEGKPYLDLSENGPSILFSLSHSQGIAAYAFTTGRSVGIDIEKIDPTVECQNLAHQYFTFDEAQYIGHLDKQAQTEAFFRCWTRKEAYLKAAGIRPLNSFDTGLETNQIKDTLTPEHNNRWRIVTPELLSGWTTSLVIATPDEQPVSVIQQPIAMIF